MINFIDGGHVMSRFIVIMAMSAAVAAGSIFSEEEDLEVCVCCAQQPQRVAAPASSGATLKFFNYKMPNSVQLRADGLPILHSSPTSNGQLYIDFDGNPAKNQKPLDFDGDPTSFNAYEQEFIYNYWVSTAAYFSMLDIDVTTVIDVNRPHSWTVVTERDGPGVALMSSFGNRKVSGASVALQLGPYTTGVAHEGGHTLGHPHAELLADDGSIVQKYWRSSDYLRGCTMGTGDYIQNKFGNRFYTGKATLYYDDLSRAISKIKQYTPSSPGWRADDHGGDFGSPTALTADGDGFRGEGIIEQMSDSDMFAFKWKGGQVAIRTSAFGLSPVNLKFKLFDSTQKMVAVVENGKNHQTFSGALAAGDYFLKLESAGRFSDLGAYRVAVNPLPDHWQVGVVGGVRVINDISYDSSLKTWTFDSSGEALAGMSGDHFTFAYQKLSGLTELIVKVESQEALNGNVKSGLMIRESLNRDSKNFAAYTTAGKKLTMSYRSTTGGSTASRNLHSYYPWIRILRKYGKFLIYGAPDGKDWRYLFAHDANMFGELYVGAFHNSNDRRSSAKALLSGLSIVRNNYVNELDSMTVPTGMRSTAVSHHSVDLAWNAAGGVNTYQLERSSDGVNFSEIAVVNGTKYTDSTVVGGRHYFYRVRSKQSPGSNISKPSAATSVVTRAGLVYDTQLIAWSSDTVILAWYEPFNETGFRIERSENGGAFTEIGTRPADSAKFVDQTVQAGKMYKYRIFTQDHLGDSGFVELSYLSAVSDFTVDSKTNSDVSLSWTALSGAASYLLERSEDSGKTWVEAATLAAGKTSYKDTGLKPLTFYQYRISGKTSDAKQGGKTTVQLLTEGAGLGSSWHYGEINMSSGSGVAELNNGTMNVKIAAGDIWGRSDNFGLVYRRLDGDGQITARVVSQSSTNDWAKAGVMMRDSLQPGSKHSYAFVTPVKGINNTWRGSDGGTTGRRAVDGLKAPYWLRLERKGSVFTSYYSSDGKTWNFLKSNFITMNQRIYMGFATTSNNAKAFADVSYDSITYTGTSPAIGLELIQTDNILAWSVEEERGVRQYQVLLNGKLFQTILAKGDQYYSVELPKGKKATLRVVDYSGYSQDHIPADGNLVTTIYNLSKGWNLIAVTSQNSSLQKLRAKFKSPIWKWSGSAYEVVTSATPTEAVWVYAEADQTVHVNGRKSKAEIVLGTGWNMVGPIHNQNIPDGAEAVYSWDGVYDQIIDEHQVLIGGKGYWIFSF